MTDAIEVTREDRRSGCNTPPCLNDHIDAWVEDGDVGHLEQLTGSYWRKYPSEAERFARHRVAAVKAERSSVVGYLLAFTASRMRRVLAYDIARGEHTKTAWPTEANIEPIIRADADEVSG